MGVCFLIWRNEEMVEWESGSMEAWKVEVQKQQHNIRGTNRIEKAI